MDCRTPVSAWGGHWWKALLRIESCLIGINSEPNSAFTALSVWRDMSFRYQNRQAPPYRAVCYAAHLRDGRLGWSGVCALLVCKLRQRQQYQLFGSTQPP